VNIVEEEWDKDITRSIILFTFLDLSLSLVLISLLTKDYCFFLASRVSFILGKVNPIISRRSFMAYL
jgi:hypothetical protein